MTTARSDISDHATLGRTRPGLRVASSLRALWLAQRCLGRSRPGYRRFPQRIILFLSTFVPTRSLPGCKCVCASGRAAGSLRRRAGLSASSSPGPRRVYFRAARRSRFGPLCSRGGGSGLAGFVEEAAGARCGLRGGKAGAHLCGPGEDRERGSARGVARAGSRAPMGIWPGRPAAVPVVA